MGANMAHTHPVTGYTSAYSMYVTCAYPRGTYTIYKHSLYTQMELWDREHTSVCMDGEGVHMMGTQVCAHRWE